MTGCVESPSSQDNGSSPLSKSSAFPTLRCLGVTRRARSVVQPFTTQHHVPALAVSAGSEGLVPLSELIYGTNEQTRQPIFLHEIETKIHAVVHGMVDTIELADSLEEVPCIRVGAAFCILEAEWIQGVEVARGALEWRSPERSLNVRSTKYGMIFGPALICRWRIMRNRC